MNKHSRIDDIKLPKYRPKWGWPILFTNQEIRRMLNLAHVTKNDIFYDLGCGWGQNLIIAVSEFGVKKAVGIEDGNNAYKIAKWRLSKHTTLDHGQIIKGKFENLFSDKLDDVDLNEATVVFYGLDPAISVLRGLKKKLRKGCRFISYFECIFPEIRYDSKDFPFFLAKFPFKQPKSETEWLQSVIGKKGANSNELWEEFCHDFDIRFLRSDIRRYKKRLRDLKKK